MENEDIKKVFLNIAVAAISCDGDIDDSEIEKLKQIEKSSPYFSEFDLSKTLEDSLEKSIADLNEFQKNLFLNIKTLDLNFVQQLSAIDVSLEIIQADGKIENSEIDFVKNLRSCLSVSDELIEERFGQIDYLFLENKSEFKTTVNNILGDIKSGENKGK
tara:strand:+ start:144 stop:623 length:480 start_codon:yes stop_codon:yes gene_type:complete